ncbi:hypothetical protein IMSAG025_01719 [Muribaculaceae bacterium]|nr:hypothetical protein IMSAG025_01719 [Muribaculaceae bacterium]
MAIAVFRRQYPKVRKRRCVVVINAGISGKIRGSIGIFGFRIADSHIDAGGVPVEGVVGVQPVAVLVKAAVSPVHQQPEQRPEQPFLLQVRAAEADFPQGGKLAAEAA